MITHTMDRECQDLGKNKTQTWAKYIYIYKIIYTYICGETDWGSAIR